jgi:hypothetical protein
LKCGKDIVIVLVDAVGTGFLMGDAKNLDLVVV